MAALPSENLAARTIARSVGGIVTDPRERRRFVEAASSLLADSGWRRVLGQQGRRFAERRFAIDRVATEFEDVLLAATGTTRPRGSGRLDGDAGVTPALQRPLQEAAGAV